MCGEIDIRGVSAPAALLRRSCTLLKRAATCLVKLTYRRSLLRSNPWTQTGAQVDDRASQDNVAGAESMTRSLREAAFNCTLGPSSWAPHASFIHWTVPCLRLLSTAHLALLHGRPTVPASC